MGHLKRICKHALHLADVYKRHFHQTWHVKSSGRRFPEKGCILEHRICRFPKMILRDRCNTSDDLASLFRSRRNSFSVDGVEKLQSALVWGPSALNSTCHVWRRSRRIASFLRVSTSSFFQNFLLLQLLRFQVDNSNFWLSSCRIAACQWYRQIEWGIDLWIDR